jgi:hypothetical protein
MDGSLVGLSAWFDARPLDGLAIFNTDANPRIGRSFASIIAIKL